MLRMVPILAGWALAIGLGQAAFAEDAGGKAMPLWDFYNSTLWNDPQRFMTQPFPGVTLAALKYLYLDRHVLMHGHEPLDTDNTAPEFVGEKWLLRA